MFTSQYPIDRQDPLRNDESALKKLWRDPDARVLPVHQGRCLITEPATQTAHLNWLPVQEPWQFSDAIFLGTTGDTPWFTINLSDAELGTLALPAGAKFRDLRAIGMRINHDDGALLIYAKGLTHWHSTTHYCSRCAAALENTQGGHVKRCSNTDCAALEFPRTDPAVIMLVTRTDEDGVERCLLGRSPVWPAGMYSTLAGFVESGESLQQAVIREVHEEAGIVVNNVQYMTSQPWPFPRSIMLGFRAEALTSKITLDEVELEDAQWFSRDDLNRFGPWGDANSKYQLPRVDSIAYFLLEQWRSGTHRY